MNDSKHTIYLQKMKENSAVKDSLGTFGIVCTNFPFKVGGEAKDLPKRDWPGEDGEDMFFPDKLPMQAYDLEAEMCYKGGLGKSYAKIKAFLDYLMGASMEGSAMKIYNPITGIGRKNVVYKDSDDFTFHASQYEEVVSFKVKFRVTDPRTDIRPIVDMNNVITSLA